MTQSVSTIQLDLRVLAPRERHLLIFSASGELGIGQSLELINDHDPRPLQSQFQVECPGQFSWDYLECGLGTWHVTIVKVASAASADHCCGDHDGGAWISDCILQGILL